ncbi:LacI family DNA-binding transcriptional regulator [Micromonospora sp. NPDC126480]|uniref:LacI family DNA-binding transcriptional regulator n=1 Tax=Micromonospora sp. NPDC126480 TaxID=3155312 RepID=UPI00331E1E3C
MRISGSGRSARRRVSQADIARQAGVTQAAVSMILRDRADSIPEATRQRVLTIARDLGYRADPLARRLANGRSQIIGVFTYEKVFPVAQRTFYHRFLLGIEEAAEAHDQDLLLFTSAAGRRTGRSGEVRTIYAGGENKLRLADAAVLLGRDDIPAELEQLCAEGYPFVFIGRRFLTDGREVPNVAPDYAAATRALARRFAALGHRRIAYLGADRTLPASVDRLAAIATSGLDVHLHFAPVTEIDGTLLHRLLDTGVTGLMLENSEYAERVDGLAAQMEAGRDSRLSVAVAGLTEEDSTPWSGFTVPGRRIGHLALEDLLARLEGAPPGCRLVPCPAAPGRTLTAVPPGHS